MRHHSLRHKDGAKHVCVEHVVDLLLGVVKGTSISAVPGIIHYSKSAPSQNGTIIGQTRSPRKTKRQRTKNINMIGPKRLHRALDQRLCSSLINGGADDSGFAALGEDSLEDDLGARGRRLGDVVDGYGGAVAGESSCYGCSDAVFAAGAGDDGDFAGEGEVVDCHCWMMWFGGLKGADLGLDL